MHDKILILDFGSQVTQLIARRVREANVYSEIHPYDVDASFIRDFAPKGVILSGGPSSVTEEDTPRVPQAVFELGVPVLGICYGMQAMAQQLGGKVDIGHLREFGYAEVRARNHTSLLEGISDFTTSEGHGMLKVWMSHGDKVLEMPPGFALMASTESCPIAAMADEQRRFYGLQWHPEVTHTVQGRAMLERFVLQICGAKADWEMGHYIDEAVAKIREQVGNEHVILGLSGGVDSSGGGGAAAPRDRRSTDLRVRRPWPAAPERSRAGDGAVRRSPWREGDSRRREPSIPRQARRRDRS
ncbi:GMP synthase (glutamine-hydrolyzing) A subunit [Paraburkholderia sp. MM5496-R1]